MDKAFILGEIHRTSNGSRALGQKAFARETGIKPHEWQGKYWARWGDALSEAGFAENEWQSAHEESFILTNLLDLTRFHGKFPTKYDVALERQKNPNFPSWASISRLCSRAELKTKLLAACSSNPNYKDLESILASIKAGAENNNSSAQESNSERFHSGYVYLVEAQGAYKIGSTRAPYRRAAEIANQSATGASLLHLISTDDPEGIEKYWHRRFAQMNKVGVNKASSEWFQLTNEEIKAFKRRKTM